MHRFKRVIVGMTLGETDEAKLRYAAMICRMASSELVYFIHIVSRPGTQEERNKENREISKVTADKILQRMEELVTKYFNGSPNTRREYVIMDDAPLIHIELLRRFKDMDIDLLVLGKIRGELTQRGTVPVKVARKAPCSVFFVPEGMKPEFTNVLVPVDFSDRSLDALDVAISFAAASNLKSIRCLNAYSVPIGYHKSGKSYEQFAEIMKSHAESNFKKFADKLDLRNVDVIPVYRLERNACKAIDEYVREHYIDLLIIGARGRRTGAAFLLGSVTEKLISSTSMPLLAVKNKGEGLSVFEALLRL
jgi:nucleotide-binding universal stress UspA family protein